MTRVSALILAGGKATRFGGVAKHMLSVDGISIFDRQIAVLAPRVGEILVSSQTDIPGYRTVRDSIESAGPLAGIAAGLRETPTPWLLVVAGDMPYLTGELVDRMLAALDEALDAGDASDAVDAVGVRAGGVHEPLLCVLHVRTLMVLERRLAAGRYKAAGLLTEENLTVRWVDDADPAALRNVNSPEDLPR